MCYYRARASHGVAFNPRSLRGERPSYTSRGVMSCPAKFQSNAPAWGATEVRPARLVIGSTGFRVSIHAPAWGATPQVVDTCDRARSGVLQSTLPRGERPDHIRASFSLGFNPRSRVKRPDRIHQRNETMLFQSTLPRGERHR